MTVPEDLKRFVSATTHFLVSQVQLLRSKQTCKDQQGWTQASAKDTYLTLGLSENEVTQSCPTLCEPMDSVRGIFQARVLEWVATSFSNLPNP